MYLFAPLGTALVWAWEWENVWVVKVWENVWVVKVSENLWGNRTPRTCHLRTFLTGSSSKALPRDGQWGSTGRQSPHYTGV